MRSISALCLFALSASTLLSCAGTGGSGSASTFVPGTETDEVVIQVKATTKSPHTVKMKPDLPVVDLQRGSTLTFRLHNPPAPGARWKKIEVGDFSKGSPSAECADIANPANTNPCVVTFSSVNGTEVFKYSIGLYADASSSSADVILDPVGIIKG